VANIKFWSINGTEVSVTQYICFASLSGCVPKQVRYLCYVDRDLSTDDARFYIDFIHKIFGDKFTSRLVVMNRWKSAKNTHISSGVSEPTPRARWIDWRLNSGGMKYGKALTYLTAFRYPHEYPQIISQLVKRRKPDSSIEEDFELFQKIHLEIGSGENHELISSRRDYCTGIQTRKPISLEDFRKNLANPLITRVYAHFIVT
jgi:hypothetical protein